MHQIEQCYFFFMQLLRNYKGPKLKLWLQMQFGMRMFHVYFSFVKSDSFFLEISNLSRGKCTEGEFMSRR